MKTFARLICLVSGLCFVLNSSAQMLPAGHEHDRVDIRPFGVQVPRLPAGTEFQTAQSTPVPLAVSSKRKGGESKTESSGGSGSQVQTAGTMGTHVQGGHSGNWFNPLEDGHGIVIEVVASSSSPTGKAIVLYWYAYLDGEQIWLVAVGPVINQGNQQFAELDSWVYEGNDFPPFYTISSTQEIPWGTITVRFDGCGDAFVTWNSVLPGFGSGSMGFEKLTTVLQTSCNPTLGGDTGGGTQDDHGNSWQSATSLGTNPSSLSVSGNLETQGDDDVFTFTVSGNRDFQLYTSGNTDTYGRLYQIVGGTEQLLLENDDGGDVTNFSMSANLGSGQYSLHVTGFGGTSTGSYTLYVASQPVSSGVQRTVHFDNRLLMPINILINGVPVGSVAETSTAQGSYVLEPGDVFSFEVIQPYGDYMSGVYSAVGGGSGQLNYLVNTLVGSQWYFIPYFTNNSATEPLLAVNWDLQSENRCNCVIPAFTSNVRAGYFLLWSNSNVYLFEQAYGGAGIYWENFSNNVNSETGRINFVYP